MNGQYTLDDDGNPVPCDDIKGWASWYHEATKNGARMVLQSKLDGWLVSTVFLGIDHNFGDGPPLLFETMIFGEGSWSEDYQERYATRADALKGHEAAKAWLEKKLEEKQA